MTKGGCGIGPQSKFYNSIFKFFKISCERVLNDRLKTHDIITLLDLILEFITK